MLVLRLFVKEIQFIQFYFRILLHQIVFPVVPCGGGTVQGISPSNKYELCESVWLREFSLECNSCLALQEVIVLLFNDSLYTNTGAALSRGPPQEVQDQCVWFRELLKDVLGGVVPESVSWASVPDLDTRHFLSTV